MAIEIYGETTIGGSMYSATAVAVSVNPTRCIFKCRKCKKAWARDYKKVFSFMGGIVGRGYYPEPARYELQRVENGQTIRQIHDFECPHCGANNEGVARNVTGDAVKGTISDKKCDARCTGAKGHDCECQCGGANHGADHLM